MALGIESPVSFLNHPVIAEAKNVVTSFQTDDQEIGRVMGHGTTPWPG